MSYTYYAGSYFDLFCVLCIVAVWFYFGQKQNGHVKWPLKRRPYKCLNMELFQTITDDNLEELRKFLEGGSDANVVNERNKKNTLLHFAIEKNREDIVRELLSPKWNVDINSQNSCGDTPLHVAALKGHDIIVHLLLERQAVSTITNNEDMTFVDVLRRQTLLLATPQSLKKVREDFVRKCVAIQESAKAGTLNTYIFIFMINYSKIIILISYVSNRFCNKRRLQFWYYFNIT